MRISAKVDYAVQAVTQIAFATSKGTLTSTEEIAETYEIPLKFLESILSTLSKAGIVNSYRGPSGGYELAKSAERITVADIFRIIDGPLASVRGQAPEDIAYQGPAKHISDVWVATRVSLRHVLEQITIQDILNGKFDPAVRKMITEKDAWKRRKA